MMATTQESAQRLYELRRAIGSGHVFEVSDLGEDGEQYFQGFGCYGSRFESATTGIGLTFAEALDDAKDSAAQSMPTWMAESLDWALIADEPGEIDPETSNDEWHRYVGIRW